MKKQQARDFVIFQREFKRWQQRFGLNGYKVYLKHEPLEDCFANIELSPPNMVATVSWNSAVPEKDIPFLLPRVHAKHEALHLLVGRLENCGRARYIRSDEIYEAAEELVRRLETLIP